MEKNRVPEVLARSVMGLYVAATATKSYICVLCNLEKASDGEPLE